MILKLLLYRLILADLDTFLPINRYNGTLLRLLNAVISL